MKLPAEVALAAGMALPSPATPIAVQYDMLLVVFVFETRSGKILDAEANMVCGVTSVYLRQLLVNRCIYTDLEQILGDIRSKYFGISRQALLVCMKDAADKIAQRGGDVMRSAMEQSAPTGGSEQLQKITIDKVEKFEYSETTQRSLADSTRFMCEFSENAICVVGLSKTGSRNPITKVHQSLIASLIVDGETGEIFAAEFNTICKLTNLFITSLIVGKNLHHDMDEVLLQIQKRYLGDSRRALVSILRDAQNKLLTYQAGRTTEE